jgi:hypothetical protein
MGDHNEGGAMFSTPDTDDGMFVIVDRATHGKVWRATAETYDDAETARDQAAHETGQQMVVFHPSTPRCPDCDSFLTYVAAMGAPGYGTVYRCDPCSTPEPYTRERRHLDARASVPDREFVVFGSSIIDPRTITGEPPWILRPEDVR